MASLNSIVNVKISLSTLGIKGGNFGTPLILAPLMTFAERVRVYTSYASAAEDDLPPLVKTALSDCFAQIPAPSRVKVGRRSVLKGVINVSELIPFGIYSFSVDGEVYSYTADGTPVATEIVTGLAAAVLADTNEIITATVAGNTLEVAWIGANLGAIELVSNLDWGLISPLAAVSAVADDLDAILVEDRDWYGLVLTERVKQAQLDAAEWVESNERLFITATNEADVLNPSLATDLISLLKASNYNRTAVIYHTNAGTEYVDAAWAGRVFTIVSGAETWALKTLSSVIASKLSDTQRQTIFNKGGNTFEVYGNTISLTNPGKVASGEWIDVVRFRDWLKDLIQVNMVQMMINRSKVPYTDPGILLIANNLTKSLATGQSVGGIAPSELDANGVSIPGFVVTYPRSVDVAPNVKATRVIYVGFTARLAGAIHLAEITGNLGYEL